MSSGCVYLFSLDNKFSVSSGDVTSDNNPSFNDFLEVKPTIVLKITLSVVMSSVLWLFKGISYFVSFVFAKESYMCSFGDVSSDNNFSSDDYLELSATVNCCC